MASPMQGQGWKKKVGGAAILLIIAAPVAAGALYGMWAGFILGLLVAVAVAAFPMMLLYAFGKSGEYSTKTSAAIWPLAAAAFVFGGLGLIGGLFHSG